MSKKWLSNIPPGSPNWYIYGSPDEDEMCGTGYYGRATLDNLQEYKLQLFWERKVQNMEHNARVILSTEQLFNIKSRALGKVLKKRVSVDSLKLNTINLKVGRDIINIQFGGSPVFEKSDGVWRVGVDATTPMMRGKQIYITYDETFYTHLDRRERHHIAASMNDAMKKRGFRIGNVVDEFERSIGFEDKLINQDEIDDVAVV